MDSIASYGAACEQYEDKTPDTLMSNCWKLLGDILSVARARGLNPQSEDYIDALLQVGDLVQRGLSLDAEQSILLAKGGVMAHTVRSNKYQS